MHLLCSLFSATVGLYTTARRLFTFRGELPNKGLLPVVELTSEAFAVRHSLRAVPPADHVLCLRGVSPPDWKLMPCKQVGKLSTGSCDLACRGLTFAPLDCAAWTIGGQRRSNQSTSQQIARGYSPF